MKKVYQIVFLIVVVTFCVLSCSKEDENSSINQNGGEVFRSQVVIIDLPGVDLDQNEYQALFGGQNITVSKSDEHKLFFLVPYSTTVGMHDLVISTLNDATIHYDVKEIVLSETVEVTMQSFFANLQTFTQNLDTSTEATDAQNAVDSFNSYYSNATLEDKTEIAILYKANKIMFDRVLQNIDITSRAIDTNALCLGKAVIGMGASIPLLLAPTGATQIAGVVLFGTSAYYAKKCGKPLWNEYVLASFINVNGILGTNQRSTFVTFTNDVNSTLSLNTVNRKLISSDASRTESTWVYFFPYFNLLNTNIAKVNAAIQEVNNLPFVNFPLIPQIQLPASSPEVNTVVNQTVFSNIQFSVSHPNLQLVSSSLQSDGQLNMKIKIIDTPTVLPVESFLNYTYSDDFSEFSGKLPVKVYSQSCGDVMDIDGNVYPTIIIGTQCWMQKNLNVSQYRNGDPIPQVTSYSQWQSLTTGAWCYAENNTANGTVYGKLYNWYAINDPRGLAPQGYHLPSDEEWTTLTTQLGGESVAGGVMKAGSYWTNPNNGATNSSGFTGLPGGLRYSDGSLSATGYTGAWWTSSQQDISNAWSREIGNLYIFVQRIGRQKTEGHSVRCIKD